MSREGHVSAATFRDQRDDYRLGEHETVRVIDAAIGTAREWVRSGARVHTKTREGDRIALVRSFGPWVCLEEGIGLRRWTSWKRLAEALPSRTEWRVVSPSSSLGEATSSPEGPRLTPLERTYRLLRLDGDDLTVVMLYGAVTGFLYLSVPIAAQSLVNTVAFGTLLQPLFVLSVLLGLALTGSAILRALSLRVVETLQRRLFARVVEHLAEKIPRVEPKVWSERHGPELLNRFFDLFTIKKAAATLLLDGTDAVLIAIVGLGLLAFYHPALLAFVAFLIVAAAVIFGPLGTGGIKSAVYESKAKYSVASWFEEMTRHPIAFRQGAGPEFALERTQELGLEYLKNREKHFRVVFRQFKWALAIQVFASAAVLGLGGLLVIQRQLTIGQLVASELIVSAVVSSFAKLGSKVETFYDLVAAVDKIGELLDLPLEKGRDAPHTEPLDCVGLDAEGLRVEPMVEPLDFHVVPGSVVRVERLLDREAEALTNFLFGFEAEFEGMLRLGGADHRDLPLFVLRKELAVVRRPELLPHSVLENLRVARGNVSRAEAWDLLERVALAKAVRGLEKGLDTEVRTDRPAFSRTGEIQLAIARALAQKPQVVVLDRCLDGVPLEDKNRILSALSATTDCGFLVLSGSAELQGRRVSITSLRPTPAGTP